jgi:hypothetical protein
MRDLILTLVVVLVAVVVHRHRLHRDLPAVRGTSMRWWHLTPQDILFWLASFAALDLVVFWLPVFYFTTYEGSSDGNEGVLMFPATGICPASWVVGGICFWQVWRRHPALAPRHRLALRLVATLLMLIILSTLADFVWRTVSLSQRLHGH